MNLTTGHQIAGPATYPISTPYSVNASQLQQYHQRVLEHPNAIESQQLNLSFQPRHINRSEDSISPRSRQPSEVDFTSNQLDQSRPAENPSSEFPFYQNHIGLQGPSSEQAFESLLIDPTLRSDQPSPRHSVNPADLMTQMSSPFQDSQQLSSNATRVSREASPNPHANHSLEQLSFHSPHHSPQNSLDPASAAFSQGQTSNDWASLLQGASFQGHRKTPSEISDVSSSVAPSPFLGTVESFEGIEQQHSPLLRSQRDSQMYQDELGIEHFTISDPSQNQGLSPRPSPHVSPRLLPHNAMAMSRGNSFVLSHHTAPNQLDTGMPPEVYTGLKQERVPSVQLNNGSGELGYAAQMATPEINIEFAAPSRQQHLGPPESVDDGNALSPPERGRLELTPPPLTDMLMLMAGRKGRVRAKSDSYIGSSAMPRSSSSGATSPLCSQRSLSPHDIVPSGVSSQKSSRRSSTSSLPNRDYILDLADPQRPGSNASDPRRVQKHPATFQCSLCPKRFTRAYNLRSHLRTHTDERPFVCNVCGKAFARQHDRKRHEGLHSGEKKFVCKGDLKLGSSWGCGRRFARADALGRHFRSEAGRICIKPLLDEEAAQRQRSWNENQLLSQPAGHPGLPSQASTMGQSMDLGSSVDAGNSSYMLPQALLAQYPALANIPWDSLGSGGPGDEGDLSGRSSFDASSGGEYYEDDNGEGGGYVSGPGTEYAAASMTRWGSGNGWGSDYEGSGR